MTFTKAAELAPRLWHIVDARNQVVGRLAPQVARLLMGKHKPTFMPHVDCGDWVVVINARHAKLTGKKYTDKLYKHHTQWMGGLKTLTARQLHERAPERLIEHAVKGMMTGNLMRHHRMFRLRVFADEAHTHTREVAESARYAPAYLEAHQPKKFSPKPVAATGALVRDLVPGVRDPDEIRRLAAELHPDPPEVTARRLAELEELLAQEHASVAAARRY